MFEKIEKDLDAYYDMFDGISGNGSSNMDENKIKNEIFECLKKKKKAQELWPSEYGSANGNMI